MAENTVTFRRLNDLVFPTDFVIFHTATSSARCAGFRRFCGGGLRVDLRGNVDVGNNQRVGLCADGRSSREACGNRHD